MTLVVIGIAWCCISVISIITVLIYFTKVKNTDPPGILNTFLLINLVASIITLTTFILNNFLNERKTNIAEKYLSTSNINCWNASTTNINDIKNYTLVEGPGKGLDTFEGEKNTALEYCSEDPGCLGLYYDPETNKAEFRGADFPQCANRLATRCSYINSIGNKSSSCDSATADWPGICYRKNGIYPYSCQGDDTVGKKCIDTNGNPVLSTDKNMCIAVE